MLPGEKHRERVLTAEEEDLYFRAAGSEPMEQHADPRLLADVARILLDCAHRPEECFRLKPAKCGGRQACSPLRQKRQRAAPHSNDTERANHSRHAPYKGGWCRVGFPGP